MFHWDDPMVRGCIHFQCRTLMTSMPWQGPESTWTGQPTVVVDVVSIWRTWMVWTNWRDSYQPSYFLGNFHQVLWLAVDLVGFLRVTFSQFWDPLKTNVFLHEWGNGCPFTSYFISMLIMVESQDAGLIFLETFFCNLNYIGLISMFELQSNWFARRDLWTSDVFCL